MKNNSPVDIAPFPRRHDLDALRAGAMFIGIALHAALSFVAFPWPAQDMRQTDVFGVFFFAVHGFRMPLFFLISGFFTAMLWRRRGLSRLIRHRFKRIFLPLLLGLFTVVPAVSIVSGMAMSEHVEELFQEGAEAQAERETSLSKDPELITAIRKGQTVKVKQLLENDADLEVRDSMHGVLPLSWAAMTGDAEVVELLLDHEAKVDGRNRDGSTAMHGAAFLGRVQVVEVLLAHDADVRVRNHKGELPRDAMAADWGVTQFVAGLLRITLESEAEIEAGREAIYERIQPLMKGNPAKNEKVFGNLESGKGDVNGLKELREAYWGWVSSAQFQFRWEEGGKEKTFQLFFSPVFHHLWFLWFLCWLVAFFSVFALLAERVNYRKPPQSLMLTPLRLLWLLPLTFLPQYIMGILGPSFGPDTSAGLLPQPHLLFYYGIFFFFGVFYFDCDDQEGRLGRLWWLSLPFAIFIALPVGLSTMEHNRLFSSIAQVNYAWGMTFGLMGLCRHLLKTENRILRYISDSSYWLYLVHLPLVIFAQHAVREWPLPAFVKFTLICVIVTSLSLVVYQFCVRYTPLGALLNGPRTRPQRSSAVAAGNDISN